MTPGVHWEASDHDDEAGPCLKGGGQARQGEKDLGEQDGEQLPGVGESGECFENGQKYGWATCDSKTKHKGVHPYIVSQTQI